MNLRPTLLACGAICLLGTTASLTGDVAERATSPRPPRRPDIDQVFRPDPGLRPEDVVRIQLQALRDNRRDNRGIAHCFEFASPENREHTGPIESFVQMVRSHPYRLLLNHQIAIVGTADIKDQRASMIATLIDSSDRLRVFSFVLSIQQEEPYQNCWMTDGVTSLPLEGPLLKGLTPNLMAAPAESSK